MRPKDEDAWCARINGRDCRAIGWGLAGEDAAGNPFASVVFPARGSVPGRYCRQTLTPRGLVYEGYPVFVASRIRP